MKSKHLLCISFFLFSFVHIIAQNLTQKQLEYEKNKVQIFTVKERDNLQIWFNEKVKLMNLSEAKEEKYNNILIFYLVKMGRLDDKDMGNSKEEILQKLDELLLKQDKEIKAILSKEEYEIHLKNYSKMLKSIRNRISETDYSKHH